MAPTTIDTASFSLTLDMPERLSSAMKLDAFIAFLTGVDLGSDRLTWETPLSQTFVSLTATRSQRPIGSYYREPYPLTLALEFPSLAGTPVLRVSLSPSDFAPLMSSLRTYASNLRALSK